MFVRLFVLSFGPNRNKVLDSSCKMVKKFKANSNQCMLLAQRTQNGVMDQRINSVVYVKNKNVNVKVQGYK